MLIHLTTGMEPDFASRTLRIRKWTAFKGERRKSKESRNCKRVLEGSKITLMLELQIHHMCVSKMCSI